MTVLVAVAPDKFTMGISSRGAGDLYLDGDGDPLETDQLSRFVVCPLVEALNRVYSTDAHLVVYTIDAARQPRINKSGLSAFDYIPLVNVFFADVDNAGHAEWTDEARASARQQEASNALLSSAGIYDTAHGRRIVQPLQFAIPVTDVEPYIERWLNELEASGISVDRACGDWTRHYRLPHVNGRLAAYIDLSHMSAIDLPPLPVKVESAPKQVATPRLVSEDSATRRAKAYADSVPEAIQGSHGDDQTHYLCCRMVRGFGLNNDQALSAMADWNSRCQPPWAEEELAKKLDNARRNGTEAIGSLLNAPAANDVESLPAGFMDIDPKNLIRMPGCDDVSDEDRRSEAAAKRRESENKLAPKLKYLFQSGPELVREPIKNQLWLVRGLLPESGVCVIAGEPKATKTWAALEIGMALATGTKAFGQYYADQKKHVAVFLAEDGKRSIQARITALSDSRHMEQCKAVERMHFICRGQINLLNKDEMGALIDSCKTIPDLGLLVMDPLRDLHAADENDSTAMAKVTHALRWLRDSIGCAILFVHHAHKSSKESEGRRPGQRMRGSSVIHGAIDAGIYMSATKTDLQSYWTNDVSVEIKEGAGAGLFKLTLNLDNDEDGRARGGSWSVEQESSKGTSERVDGARQSIVQALQSAKGKPIGARRLREACKIGDRVLYAALDALKADNIVAAGQFGYSLVSTKNQVVNPSTTDHDFEQGAWMGSEDDRSTKVASAGVDGSNKRNSKRNTQNEQPIHTHPQPIHAARVDPTLPPIHTPILGVDGVDGSGACAAGNQEKKRRRHPCDMSPMPQAERDRLIELSRAPIPLSPMDTQCAAQVQAQNEDDDKDEDIDQGRGNW